MIDDEYPSCDICGYLMLECECDYCVDCKLYSYKECDCDGDDNLDNGDESR